MTFIDLLIDYFSLTSCMDLVIEFSNLMEIQF